MKPNIVLTNLSPRQRQVWHMRHKFGWRIPRIATELGINKGTVCRILQRARRRAGLPVRRRGDGSYTPKWRVIRPVSLSSVFNC